MSQNNAPAAELMADPGEQLRQARERLGMSLQEISKQTLIPVARLQAIENHDFDTLGGLPYVTGYARAYARALKLESKPFVQSFEAIFGVEKQEVEPVDFQLSAPGDNPKRKGKWLIGLVVVVALTVLLYELFIRINSEAPSSTPIADGPSAISLDEARAAVSSSATLPIQDQPLPNISSLQKFREAAEAIPDVLEETPESTPVDILSTQSDESVQPNEPAAEKDEVKTEDLLVLDFTEECWVEIKDASGKVTIAQIAESGDNLQLFGEQPFELMLGNARAATIALNGELVDVPLQAGRRTARFTVGSE